MQAACAYSFTIIDNYITGLAQNCLKKYIFIMKRKGKQLWSTIPPISTKQTITLASTQSLNIKKNHDILYGIGNQCPGLGRAQKCGRVKSVSLQVLDMKYTCKRNKYIIFSKIINCFLNIIS